MKTKRDSWLWLLVLAMLVMVILAGGCHTISGIGQDLIDTTKQYTER